MADGDCDYYHYMQDGINDDVRVSLQRGNHASRTLTHAFAHAHSHIRTHARIR